jgi:hypothetical protein
LPANEPVANAVNEFRMLFRANENVGLTDVRPHDAPESAFDGNDRKSDRNVMDCADPFDAFRPPIDPCRGRQGLH